MKKYGPILLAAAMLATPPCVGTQEKNGAVSVVESTIRFPSAPPTPAPPPPTPAIPVNYRLTLDTLYVVDGDVAFFLLTAPTDLVRITAEVGPIRIRGKFVDGDGKSETRTYKGKQVYIVEAAKTGSMTLFAVPSGATSAKDVITKTIDVDAGEGPRPPPGPNPPGPNPPPGPAPIPLPGLRVLIVHEETEKDKLTPGQRETMYGAPMRDWLDAKCVVGPDGKTREYRIWDKDIVTTGAPKHWQDAMQRRPSSLPWLIVSNGTSGFEGPLPATMDETKALIQKYAQ